MTAQSSHAEHSPAGGAALRAPVRIGTPVPYLRCDNASAAIAFYVAVFDAHEVVRLVEPGGRVAHAELLRPPSLDPFGDKAAKLLDVCGHEWMIATRVEVVAPDKMRRRFAQPFE